VVVAIVGVTTEGVERPPVEVAVVSVGNLLADRA
jgi:hypothetical protein